MGNRTRVAAAALVAGALLGADASAQDPNFHVYLAFGQSNMEGNGQIPAAEKIGVNPRWQMMAAVNCPGLSRVKGNWYTAVPPLCRCGTGMTPADYFGRTLVDSLPAHIKVGVINVSVAGCAIEMFDKGKYQAYINGQETWMKNIANEYGGNPYGTLVDLAKKAQTTGVIKGFLLHQGESGSSTGQWAAEVKIIYNNLILDLGLDAAKTPLLAGDLGGSGSNDVKNLPKTLPNSHVISAQGLALSDQWHFTPEAYKEFGKRYGATMLGILRTNGSVGARSSGPAPDFALHAGSLDRSTGKADVRFAIPHRSFVTVKAYSVLGADIAQLAGGVYPAGVHTLEFAPSRLPAGLCVLKMQADGYSATRTMVVAAE